MPVENPGEKLGPQLVATPVEPFQRGTKRMQVSDSAWQSSNALPELTTEPSPLPHGPLAGSAARWSYPPATALLQMMMRDLRSIGRGVFPA